MCIRDSPPPPDPNVPVCTATFTPEGITLGWSLPGGNNILRNGIWIANAGVAGTSFTDTNPLPDSTYTIRNRPFAGAAFTDYDCDFTNPDPTPPPDPNVPVCVATATPEGVTLSWSLPGGNNILRNGIWIAGVGNGPGSFTDPNPPPGSTYAVRNRPTGPAFTDFVCEFAG